MLDHLRNTTFVSNASLATNLVSPVFDFQGYRNGSIQIVWSSANATDAVCTLEVSSDPNNPPANGSFITKDSSTMAVDGASGTHLDTYYENDFEERWGRFNYSKGSNTQGTYSIHYVLKE